MKKLTVCAVCVGALLIPNISNADDKDAIDHFDPMTSFEVVLKAPSVESSDKKSSGDSKDTKRKQSAKDALASAN